MNLVEIENVNGVLVTTSNRVAEELGVLHKDLLEKIDGYVRKFSSAESSAQFYILSNYKDRSGKSNRNYLITEKGVAQLLGGYSSAVEIAFNLNVAYINKFEEMKRELNNQFRIPNTFSEALYFAAEQQKQIEMLEYQNYELNKTKAYISDKKTATAMNTASQLSKENKRLEIELDLSKEYSTIKRMEIITGYRFDWRVLKRASEQLGLNIIDVYDINYGSVKSYHKNAWCAAYDLDINI